MKISKLVVILSEPILNNNGLAAISSSQINTISCKRMFEGFSISILDDISKKTGLSIDYFNYDLIEDLDSKVLVVECLAVFGKYEEKWRVPTKIELLEHLDYIKNILNIKTDDIDERIICSIKNMEMLLRDFKIKEIINDEK